MPAIGVAPEGRWTQVQWIDAGHGLPALTTAPSEAFQLSLYGWTNGYVAFGSDGGANSGTNRKPTLTSTSSADGVTWTTPLPIDLGGAPDEVTIEQVVEGPAGLVAVGRYPADTCGGPPVVAGLWHSADGEAWSPLAMTKDMTRGHVETVDGGAAGYIATGKQRDGKSPGLWLTTDAASWHPLPFPSRRRGRSWSTTPSASRAASSSAARSSDRRAVAVRRRSIRGVVVHRRDVVDSPVAPGRIHGYEHVDLGPPGERPRGCRRRQQRGYVEGLGVVDGQTWTPIATPPTTRSTGRCRPGERTGGGGRAAIPTRGPWPSRASAISSYVPGPQSGDGPQVTPDGASFITGGRAHRPARPGHGWVARLAGCAERVVGETAGRR